MNMLFSTRSLSIALTALVVTGATWFFSYYEPHDNLRRIPLKIGDTELRVEVARTDEERSAGLGGRESLRTDEGMLFVFDKQGFYVFWMKDMLFPLDIVWINKDKKIVDVITDVQPETYPDFEYVNDFLATSVLEVNAGFFEKHGLKLGDTVEFALENLLNNP